ncbi:MAG: hypothetical protein KDD47_04060 [Acidobacteria bacterium]|nr:hypothetical protein [Acidobacteriota bacterium]
MRTLRNLLLAVLLTAAGSVVYQHLGAPLVTKWLDAATVEQDVSGIEQWRVQPIYGALASRLYGRGALLAWSVPLFLLVFRRTRRRSEGLAKVLFSSYLFLAAYLAVELLAAPFLITRLGLYNYYFVLDVDHRLPPSHPGIGTNRDALRSPLERGDVSADDFNVLFTGDSFTFGLGVAWDQAFPAQVEKLLAARRPELKPRAFNMGWTSSSPVLALRLLERLGDAYRPDLLVYCLDMTDFHDDIKYQNMLDRRGIYWFFDKVPITLRLLEQVWPSGFEALYRRSNDNLPRERFFHSEQPLELSRSALRPTLANLEKLAAWAQQRDIPFVTVLLPRFYQYNATECPQNREAGFYTLEGPYSLEPFRFFDEKRSSLSFPVLSLLPTFERTEVFPTCFPDDPHWNPDGHRVAAEAITSFLLPVIDARQKRMAE